MRLILKKAFRDGTAVIEMPPLALLARLCAAVPPPRRHVVGYFGCLSSACRLRPLVIPPPHSPPPAKPDSPVSHRCRYRPYLELLQRTFPDDLAACQHCGGRLRLVALVKDQKSIERFLRGIGEPTDFPPMAPARGPPYFTPPGSRGAKTTQAGIGAFAPEPLDESA